MAGLSTQNRKRRLCCSWWSGNSNQCNRLKRTVRYLRAGKENEIKKRLLLGRKAMTNLDSILKSRDITLPAKVYLVKTMVFPVVMYEYENWTMKKAERRRIDAFELWCWRTLESPLNCKEVQPVHSEGDQPWDFFGRNDAKAEAPVLWPPHGKS